MRRTLLIITAFIALLLAGLWAVGGFDWLVHWAAGQQRGFQNAMAGALRALRAGRPGALLALMGLSFAYGFFHAVGPGHGKILIGGYGLGQRVALRRLMALALVASLAQAASAVALTYAGIWLLGWSRERMVGVTEEIFAPASYAAVGLIGLWLALRGARTVLRQRRTAEQAQAHHPHGPHHDHNHHHHAEGEVCESCGHRHLPTLDEAARVGNLREALAIIAGIAIRPCTGALFLLILTWKMGIGPAGVAGTFAMGLGTASVTMAVALAAALMREGTFAGLTGSRSTRLVAPALELAAGLIVVAVSLRLFLQAI